MTNQTQARFLFIDGLRAIAATLVVLAHGNGIFYWVHESATEGLYLNYVHPLAHLGVKIFFVVSGFVIASSVGKNRMTPQYFGNFVLRRSIRLDPTYWCAILGFVGFNSFGPDAISWETVVAHVFYVPAFFDIPFMISVFWTLCIEVQFYLVFCLLIGVSQRLASKLGTGFAFDRILPSVYAVSLLFLNAQFVDVRPHLFLHHWSFFLLGCLLYYSFTGDINRFVSLGATFALFVFGVGSPADWSVFGTAAVGLWIWLATHQGKLYSWLGSRWFRFTGRISYSLYLFHVLIGNFILAIFNKFPKHVGTVLLAYGTYIVTSFLVGWIFYRLVESPTVSLSARLKRKVPNDVLTGNQRMAA